MKVFINFKHLTKCIAYCNDIIIFFWWACVLSSYLSPQTLLWDVLRSEFARLVSKGTVTGSMPETGENTLF